MSVISPPQMASDTIEKHCDCETLDHINGHENRAGIGQRGWREAL